MMSDDLTRPIIGIENRSALEVFDIMCDRIRGAAKASATVDESVRVAAALLALAERGIPTDIQEMLLAGNPNAGIAPKAIHAAIAAAHRGSVA